MEKKRFSLRLKFYNQISKSNNNKQICNKKNIISKLFLFLIIFLMKIYF